MLKMALIEFGMAGLVSVYLSTGRRRVRERPFAIAFTIASTALCAVLLSSCMNPCGNTVLRELSSPDQRYVATVFERDCGATTRVATIVVIRPGDDPFTGDDPVDYVFTTRGEYDIRIEWKDVSHLTIILPLGGGEFHTIHRAWRDVHITYQPYDPQLSPVPR